MSDWSTGGGGTAESDARVTASSTMITVADGGSDNALGSWVQLIAATAIEAEGFILYLGQTSEDNNCLVDIGVGAAASEVVILPEVAWAPKPNVDSNEGVYVPLRIPQGVRVAARMRQEGTQPCTLQLGVTLISQGFGGTRGYGAADAIGTVSATTLGTQCDPGATANTKTLTQLVATSSNNYKAFLICVNTGGNVAISPANEALFDINVGASAGTPIIENIPHNLTGTEGFVSAIYGPYPVEVAAGERISADVQCSQTTSGDRNRYISLIGFY